MSAMTFNLVDEPWIPVEAPDGTSSVMSLREVFGGSRGIARIGGEVPTQSFAILGLLSAILRRVMVKRFNGMGRLGASSLGRSASWGPTEWQMSFHDPDGLLQDVGDYLAEFHDRFDLRDAARPFYQVADLHTSKNDYSGLEVLLADVPNGEPFFTTRLREGNQRISWAEAARWLVHVQAFDPSGIRSGAVGDPRVKGGKGYPIGPAWAAQIGGLVVERDTLWDTLTTNLVPSGVGGLQFEAAKDLPPWEREQLTEKEEIEGGREPNGPVDLATWQSRRVRLVGDGDEVVGVVLCQGDRVTPQFRQHLEPRTAWRYSYPQSKKAGTTVYMPQQLDPARSLWQGLEALLPGTSPRDERVKGPGEDPVPRQIPPAVSNWLERLIDQGDLTAQNIRYRATGVKLGTNNSVIVELVDDAVVLPTVVFAEGQDALRNQVVKAARLAQDLAREFGYYAANLARAAGADSTDGAAARAQEQMIAAAGPEFGIWVAHVAPESADDDYHEWTYRLWRISEEEAQVLVEGIPPEAFRGRETTRGEITAGLAEVYFRARRHRLGVDPPPTTESLRQTTQGQETDSHE